MVRVTTSDEKHDVLGHRAEGKGGAKGHGMVSRVCNMLPIVPDDQALLGVFGCYKIGIL